MSFIAVLLYGSKIFCVLQMIGVAFEVSDASQLQRKHKETDEDYELRRKHQIRPSSFDIITYSMCYIGLFSGKYVVEWSEWLVIWSRRLWV